MINIRDLQISAESRSLLSVDSLEITSGERIAIYGHGGSGKSLLLHFLSGKLPRELYYTFTDNFNSFGSIAYFDFNKNWTKSVISLLSESADLCLIDEPENGVSLERFKIYCDYMKAADSTIVFVTHHLHYVEECSDKVLILKSGESRGVYDRSEFFNSDDPYVQYVSTMGC